MADTTPGSGSPSGRLAVIGEAQAVAGLRSLGLDVFPLAAGEAAADRVTGLVEQGYSIIFYTAELALQLAPLLDKYRRSAVPSIVELPSGRGEPGASRLKDLVRRAVGTDVFAG
jgi:vacuolar-type H+-ATPase subunit F/Vma7